MQTPELKKKWNRHTRLRGLTIQQRLPLLISILLLTIMISFSLVSYLSAKKSALQTGRERLINMTGQLSTMLSQSAHNLVNTARAAANNEGIIETVRSAGGVLPDDAMERIQKIRSDSSIMLVELWDKNRKSFLHWGKDSVEYRVDFHSLFIPGDPNPDSAWVGKIYKVRDSLYFPTVASVYADSGIVGYLVRWHLLNATPESIEQLSQLLGARSAFYIGNADKSIWTDMRKQVLVSPKIDTIEAQQLIDYENIKNEDVLGMTQNIAQSPWQVLIEFSRDAVLETANRYMRKLILIGVSILAIGIFFAWLMSRNLTRPLDRLTRAASSIAAGDYSATVDLNRRDEVGKLARSLNAMAMQVDSAKKELEKKVIESEEMTVQLRNLSAHLQNIREEERIHIAREMHDELGQLLTGFKMDIAWLQKRITGDIDQAQAEERLKAMTTGVDEAVKFVRKLSAELRPSLLDDLGIVPALEWYSQEFQKRFLVSVNFKSTVGELNIPNEQATGLFRIYQESLTNVARHSNATAIISTFGIQDEKLTMSIVDNGKGFDAPDKGTHKTLGLLGMKERATMVGGKLDISSTPGKGTRVYITIPLKNLE